MLHRKLQELPRNSSRVRLHNRCLVTGRPKGYSRDFGLSRHVLREMAHQGLLPGVQNQVKINTAAIFDTLYYTPSFS
jgi:ribosomal protein S14